MSFSLPDYLRIQKWDAATAFKGCKCDRKGHMHVMNEAANIGVSHYRGFLRPFTAKSRRTKMRINRDLM
jgi:hypothetical protein